MRPPLSNLFAVYDADPAALDEMMLDLRRSVEFAEVWRPAPGWVAAAAPFPAPCPTMILRAGTGWPLPKGGMCCWSDQATTLSRVCGRSRNWPTCTPTASPPCPATLASYGFAQTGGATIVRSCGGLVPFYFKQSGSVAPSAPGWAISCATCPKIPNSTPCPTPSGPAVGSCSPKAALFWQACGCWNGATLLV